MPTFKGLDLILGEPKLLLGLRQRRRGIRRGRGRAFGRLCHEHVVAPIQGRHSRQRNLEIRLAISIGIT